MVNGTVIIGPLTHVNFLQVKRIVTLILFQIIKEQETIIFHCQSKDQNFFVNIAILFYNILYKKFRCKHLFK